MYLERSAIVASIFSNGRWHTRLKRVSVNFPLTHVERRCYLKDGAAACVKMMMESRRISLGEAWNIVKLTRGKGMRANAAADNPRPHWRAL